MAFAAIPTMYAGVQFRSRLEARWAAFFDLWGARWDYEPIDLSGWIPDFIVDRCLLVEVKPCQSSADLEDHTAKIASANCAAAKPLRVYLLGSNPGAILAASPREISAGTWSSTAEDVPWHFPHRRARNCGCGGQCSMACPWMAEYGLAMVRRWKAAGNAVQYKRPR